MNSDNRSGYDAGYVQACLKALFLFGYPPTYTNIMNASWLPAQYDTRVKYETDVMQWWLSTQNDGTHTKRAYKFYRFFHAWCKDQKAMAARDGTI